jgi:sporulation protein YlmC with PRC-barrel domain
VATTERNPDLRLQFLRDTREFRIPKDEVDIRGYDVLSSDARKVGEVHDLVVDTRALTVRYAQIEVDREYLGPKNNNYVLVPIDTARIQEREKNLFLPDLTAAQIASMQSYDGEALTPDYEETIRGRVGQESARPVAPEVDMRDPDVVTNRRSDGRRAVDVVGPDDAALPEERDDLNRR